jgi:sulfur carrier protein
MRVLLRNPRRELELPGPLTVGKLIQRLELNRESVLVIRGDTLVPGDTVLDDDDVVEIRPVISGGQLSEPPEGRESERGPSGPLRSSKSGKHR